MKKYPSIPTKISNGKSIYAFAKLDGSNIRAEWNNKKGFYKFGSRKRLLGTDQWIIPNAEELIRAQEKDISLIAKEHNWDRLLLFYEFWGINSEFGNHEQDDDHKVSLIDANPYKKGILEPKEYLSIFEDKIQIAPLLYHGFCDDDFVQSVRNSELDGMPPEGVVCKCRGKGNTIEMFKIKSQSWYDRLKTFCGDDLEKFKRLS